MFISYFTNFNLNLFQFNHLLDQLMHSLLIKNYYSLFNFKYTEKFELYKNNFSIYSSNNLKVKVKSELIIFKFLKISKSSLNTKYIAIFHAFLSKDSS